MDDKMIDISFNLENYVEDALRAEGVYINMQKDGGNWPGATPFAEELFYHEGRHRQRHRQINPRQAVNSSHKIMKILMLLRGPMLLS